MINNNKSSKSQQFRKTQNQYYKLRKKKLTDMTQEHILSQRIANITINFSETTYEHDFFMVA